jgi:hypothetical protein
MDVPLMMMTMMMMVMMIMMMLMLMMMDPWGSVEALPSFAGQALSSMGHAWQV